MGNQISWDKTNLHIKQFTGADRLNEIRMFLVN